MAKQFLILFMIGIAALPFHANCAGAADGENKWQMPPTDFECRWAASEIVIDGKANEQAWVTGQAIDNFYLPWLGKKSRPAKTATRAKLLWDRQYLYFFAEMDDSDLFADVKQHDGHSWNNDVFELFFKPAEDKPGYYEFQVNAAETTLDVFMPRRNAGGFERFKSDDEFHIEAKVSLNGTLNKWQDTDKGWAVEGKIPWLDFVRAGGRPAVGETWRFALCRYDYSVDFEGPELSTCAPLSVASFHQYEDYARLRFVGPDGTAAAKKADLQQYAATSRVVGSPEPPSPYRNKRVLPNLKISWPIFVIVEPGSTRMWFIDETGPYAPARLARTTDDPSTGEFETLVKYPNAVAYSIAFHPDYLENGFAYVGLNGTFDGVLKTAVIRYAVDRSPPFRFQPDSAKTIIEWPSDGHNGGAIAFGNDGMLYVTSGDGTGDSDGNVVGQDLSKLTAKVLRINVDRHDVDHPDDGEAYSVPKDNPFVGVKDARPETWAYGLRNPWRIAVDSRTGHIWVGNNGQDLFEQVYLIERGANYGWSAYEGSQPFYRDRERGPSPVSKPTAEHHHSESRSLTGGVVYYGKNFPELHGAYIYGDHSTGKIWGIKHDGQKVLWNKELADTTLQITGFGLDVDGELLIVDHQGNEQGGYHTLEKNPDNSSHKHFPRRLSDSGLFRSIANREVEPGVIPYSVNSPLWSDGAHKERFFALPPTMIDDGEEVPAKISFSSGGWSFPDRTVLIKSFALDLKEGDPSSRRWIETRFLTRQQGEWVGYSYEWNDEQTDATLVEKVGQDREFEIATGGGRRRQKWHYPSRTECMVCHSRAANFTLGLTTPQMNREHDYGHGVVESQVQMFERLGLLKINWQWEATEALRKNLTAKGLESKDVENRLQEITATRDQRKAPPSSLLFQLPEKYDRLANPYDPAKPVEARARSYLQVNCAQCHVLAGGGNAQFDIAITTPLDQTKLLNVKPKHHTFDIHDPMLIAPGRPERSVLLRRISHREAGHMPPLATSIVDVQAVNLIRQWIADLPVEVANPNDK